MRSYIKMGFFFIPLLICVLLFNYFSPPQQKIPSPYSSSVVAFEFVQSEEDVREVLDPLTTDEVRALEWLNKTDFAFMIFYCLFLLGFWKILARLNQVSLWPGFVLIAIIYIADVIETIQLLDISQAYLHNIPFSSSLQVLAISTWSKWIGLAVLLAVIAYHLWSPKLANKLTSILILIPGLLSLPGLFGSDQLRDIFANSIFLAFLVLIVFCFTFKTVNESKSHSDRTT